MIDGLSILDASQPENSDAVLYGFLYGMISASEKSEEKSTL